MFKGRDKPDEMAAAAASFAERAAAIARLEDTGDRYASALRLRDEIDRYLRDRQREYDGLQDKRMGRTMLGIGASVPLGIGAAAALGTPLGILLIGPAMMGMSVYASRRHRQDAALFTERMEKHGPVIQAARADAVREMDDITAHRLESLARSPKAKDLVAKYPALRDAFAKRGLNDAARPNRLPPNDKNDNGFRI